MEESNLTGSSIARSTTTDATVDLQRAWYLLSLLLRIGRPISLFSLSSHCILFPSHPHYITYLCSIPNSPIFLTTNLHVAPSLIAFNALQNFISNFNGFVPQIELGVFRPARIWDKAVRTYQRRRRRKRVGMEFEPMPVPKKRLTSCKLDGEHNSGISSIAENEENQVVAYSKRGDSSNFAEGLSPAGDYMVKEVGKQARILNPVKENVYRKLDYGSKNIDLENCKKSSIFQNALEHEHADTSKCHNSFLKLRNSSSIPHLLSVQNIKPHMLYLEHYMQSTSSQESIAWIEAKMGNANFERKTRLNSITCLEVEEQSKFPPVEAEKVSHACQLNNSIVVEDDMVDNSRNEKILSETTIGNTFKAVTCIEMGEQSRALPVEVENVSSDWKPNNAEGVDDESVNNCKTEETLVDRLQHERQYAGPAFDNDDMVFLRDANRINLCIDMIPSKEQVTATAREASKDSPATHKPSFCHNQPSKASACAKTFMKDALNPGQQDWSDVFGNNRAISSPSGHMQYIRDKSTISIKQKVKRNREESMLTIKDLNFKEKWEKLIATSLKNQRESKPLPNFELYTIEEEEGSGGYGTVYRAHRKSDGVTFAIKCPHYKANRHHVDNELKMLERFGGKNSVIKYEGSFKSGGSDCLVLEHVQHDRPEILKREIEVSQLLWYGYCMFRALAALHKQGIVHRDVKPGNFLFSRKVNQGFLIDFNLAMDLHQKYGTNNKAKKRYSVNSNYNSSVNAKTLPLASKKFLMNKPTESTSKDIVKGSKPQILNKTQKMNDVGQKQTFSGQGADGSGVTSAKDATSTRIPSGEKSKEPIMVQGRKALVTFAHKTRQGPDYETQIIPASKRKRVSALSQKVDTEDVCLTPMPLFCNGVEVAGSGRIKDNEGDKRQRREGPCVGTKGFRAPEVLLRSAHQGPKIDVWSAGVTLLYLMIGRTPFTGEPEQNIKDIAKLRGSEDLWEVAKLHNRVSSFPLELHDVQFLSSVKLKDWCKQNTRRPEFFQKIPISLFDLVDKCLTVNPRSRLTAEEALRHEFFSHCRVELRKMRPRGKEPSLDSATSHLLPKESGTLECFL